MLCFHARFALFSRLVKDFLAVRHSHSVELGAFFAFHDQNVSILWLIIILRELQPLRWKNNRYSSHCQWNSNSNSNSNSRNILYVFHVFTHKRASNFLFSINLIKEFLWRLVVFVSLSISTAKYSSLKLLSRFQSCTTFNIHALNLSNTSKCSLLFFFQFIAFDQTLNKMPHSIYWFIN